MHANQIIQVWRLFMASFRASVCFFGAAILTLAAVLHFYWAFGGDAGQSISAPQLSGRSVFHVPRYSNAVVALGLLASALLLAVRAGAFGSAVRTPATAVVARVLAVIFALRAIGEFHYVGFFKSVRGTPFAHHDTWLYNPLFVCLAVVCATASLD
jgi:hypothetical protein